MGIKSTILGHSDPSALEAEGSLRDANLKEISIMRR